MVIPTLQKFFLYWLALPFICVLCIQFVFFFSNSPQNGSSAQISPEVTVIQESIPTPTLLIEERIDRIERQIAQSSRSSWIKSIEELLTIIAIVVGGVWTYWLFVKNRQTLPRASLKHTIAHAILGDDKVLLHVTVSISNLGNVILSIVSFKTRIHQVLPLDDDIEVVIRKGEDPVQDGETEIEWPLVTSHRLTLRKGEMEVEPNEVQEISHDFIIESEVQVIEIYSYLLNEEKRGRELAWDITSMYDLRPGDSTIAPLKGGVMMTTTEKDRGSGLQRSPKKVKVPKEDEIAIKQRKPKKEPKKKTPKKGN